MTGPVSFLRCQGCASIVPPEVPAPFRCEAAVAGDDTDHRIDRVLDTTRLAFPQATEPNPFLRYRVLLHSYHHARAMGLSDASYSDLVRELDAAVARTDGAGFRITPLGASASLGAELGLPPGATLWVKDETHNVSGSHKARHLMGLLLFLEVQRRCGRLAGKGRPLAIASCGNAALAAAVVARAGERRLRVFVPPSANPAVLERLRSLDAEITLAGREPGGPPGDPCYHAFRAAVAAGAIPFCCQGPDNGLTIEGGQTLGYELVSELAPRGLSLDRLFIQVGGGALASAVMAAFEEAVALGRCKRLPRLHAVQTTNAHPLVRAYRRVCQRIGQRLIETRAVERWPDPTDDAAQAQMIELHGWPALVAEALRFAATHRSEFMWPWEEEPHSVAHGILDDETYDWLSIVRAMLLSGGYPVLADEAALRAAQALGSRATGIPVDPTGAAGLAGLLASRDRLRLRPDEQLAVIFSGVQR
ncbi:MAG: pyridoxal-phosphate dependent enzyme [Deltaproteobacteria bacterium]|nr:pyridoxal-phosphate dependent enzyme [Deltaproteobacteria bacterium]